MQILLQLGANETVFIQFIIFIVVISYLTTFVYGPYFKAWDQRMQQIKGADQVAQETHDEAKKIEAVYQIRAREINEKIKAVFDASRKQATDSAATLLNQAKSLVADLTDKASQDITAQKQNAAKDIQTISAEVANEISKKLTGAI
jgi:F-type H+-transporting ATPase subunit b